MKPHFPENFWNGRQFDAFELPTDAAAFDLTDWQDRLPFDDVDFGCEFDESSRIDQLEDGTLVSVPESYEAKYAYPLIVWLCGQQHDEQELLSLTRRIDSRNYLGMAFPVDVPQHAESLDHWVPSAHELDRIATSLKDACCRMRADYHLHTERVYLAGFDDAATIALELVLQRPEWFAGAMTFGGTFPRTDKPLTRFRDLPGKRVMIGADIRDLRHNAADLARTGRMLHRAGVDVSTRVYDSDRQVTPQMLSDMNHWIMGGITAGV